MADQLTQREWLREARLTSEDTYRMGPTGNYIERQAYYETVIPLFIDMTPRGSLKKPVLSQHAYRNMVRGNILPSNQSIGQKGDTGDYFVHDSPTTRHRLTQYASLPTPQHRKAWLHTHLLTITFADAWAAIVSELMELQKKLTGYGWEIHLDKNARVNLYPTLKLGKLIDSGRLPPVLLNAALKLASTRMRYWLQHKHESRGLLGDTAITFMYQLHTVHITEHGTVLQIVYTGPAQSPGLYAVTAFKKPRTKKPARPAAKKKTTSSHETSRYYR